MSAQKLKENLQTKSNFDHSPLKMPLSNRNSTNPITGEGYIFKQQGVKTKFEPKEKLLQ